MKKSILIILSLILLFAAGYIFSVSSNPAFAGVNATKYDDVTGFAWSDNIGWISASSCFGVGCGSHKYGLDMSTTTGDITGYAWSDNIGWISFNGGTDINGCGSEAPHVDFTSGIVTGWARAIAGIGRTDGWDGCISLSGSDPDYGVTYDKDTQLFGGFAWGSEVVGWISFDGVLGPFFGGPLTVPKINNLQLNSSTCNADGSQRVVLTYNLTGTLPITVGISRDGVVQGAGGLSSAVDRIDSPDPTATYSYTLTATSDIDPSLTDSATLPPPDVKGKDCAIVCEPGDPDCTEDNGEVHIKSFTGETVAKGAPSCNLSWEFDHFDANSLCTLYDDHNNHAPGAEEFSVKASNTKSPYTVFAPTSAGFIKKINYKLSCHEKNSSTYQNKFAACNVSGNPIETN